MLVNATSTRASISMIQSALTTLMALHLDSLNYGNQTCVSEDQTFDYIVIGAGTAGGVVGSRLAEDKNITVLIIEAGGIPGIASEMPALTVYCKSNTTTWPYSDQDPGPSQQTRRKTNNDLSLGKIIGGSSSCGYETYNEGDKNDYNNWSKILNSSIWKYENVLHYFKKSQRLEDPYIKKTEGEHYGENGKIGLSTKSSISAEGYLNMFKEAGNVIRPSLNAINNTGVAKALFTISNNLRQSSATSYIAPEVMDSNLFILRNAEVIQIIFDDCKNAIGVVVYAETCSTKYIYIKAKIEVILSAGIVNSPKLLMLSGIGSKEHLSKYNIKTLVELPVGEGLQQHEGVTIVANFTQTVTPYMDFTPTMFEAAVIIGNEVNQHDEYLDVQSVNYIDLPTNFMKYCVDIYEYNNNICNNFLETSVISQIMYTLLNKQKSKTRGRIFLKSGDFRDAPLIYLNFTYDDKDVEEFAKILLNFFSKIENTKTFKELGGKYKDPKLPKCGRLNTTSLSYLKCYAKYMRTSQHQYASTCAMGSVVDPRLRVYQVQRLRVVDASVMIYPPFGGTLGATIMIAEKAADMIKEDRGQNKNECKN